VTLPDDVLNTLNASISQGDEPLVPAAAASSKPPLKTHGF